MPCIGSADVFVLQLLAFPQCLLIRGLILSLRGVVGLGIRWQSKVGSFLGHLAGSVG